MYALILLCNKVKLDLIPTRFIFKSKRDPAKHVNARRKQPQRYRPVKTESSPEIQTEAKLLNSFKVHL